MYLYFYVAVSYEANHTALSSAKNIELSLSSPHILLVRYRDAPSPYLISLDLLNAGAIFLQFI